MFACLSALLCTRDWLSECKFSSNLILKWQKVMLLIVLFPIVSIDKHLWRMVHSGSWRTKLEKVEISLDVVRWVQCKIPIICLVQSLAPRPTGTMLCVFLCQQTHCYVFCLSTLSMFSVGSWLYVTTIHLVVCSTTGTMLCVFLCQQHNCCVFCLSTLSMFVVDSWLYVTTIHLVVCPTTGTMLCVFLCQQTHCCVFCLSMFSVDSWLYVTTTPGCLLCASTNGHWPA